MIQIESMESEFSTKFKNQNKFKDLLTLWSILRMLKTAQRRKYWLKKTDEMPKITAEVSWSSWTFWCFQHWNNRNQMQEKTWAQVWRMSLFIIILSPFILSNLTQAARLSVRCCFCLQANNFSNFLRLLTLRSDQEPRREESMQRQEESRNRSAPDILINSNEINLL